MKFRYSIIKCLVPLLNVLVFCNDGISQSFINKTANNRAAIEITESTGYNFKIVDGKVTQDSVIAVNRKFNSRGFRTETTVYSDGVISMKYEYEYLGDTLGFIRRTYSYQDSGLVLLAETKRDYDKNFKLKKVYDIYSSSKYKGKSKYNYNKKGQLKRYRLKFNGRKVKDIKYKYDVNGNIIEIENLVPTKETFVSNYDDNNQVTHRYRLFKNGKKNLIKYYDYSIEPFVTSHTLNRATTILGINGKTKLWTTDVLTTEVKYHEDCQIHQETEYLNGKLNGFRKYFYNK